MNNVLLDFAARKLGARASAAEALVERASNHALAMRMHGARLRGLPGAMLLEDLCDAISGKYEPEGLVEDGDELTDRMTVAEGMKMLGIQKFEAFAVAINASVGSMKERRHAGQARQDRAGHLSRYASAGGGMICIHCGHGALRIHVTSGQAECLSASCGKDMPLTGKADRDRLRRIALGRIPANQDCPHTNQCSSALRGDCYRAQFQAEEYSCPVARGMESGRAA